MEPNSGGSSPEPKTLAIIFSSGDLGDVGRHAVAAALELPPSVVGMVRVMSNSLQSLEESQWKCGCGIHHEISKEDRQRLQLFQVDVTTEPIAQHLEGVSAVISCLGNRKPFHPDCIAKAGTQRIVDTMIEQRVQRLVMLSSVGIADDWPPMEWSPEGSRLQGFFRTVCWSQYQDLSGAELAVRQGAQRSSVLDFLIVRSVNMNETDPPAGGWYIQNTKHKDHPGNGIAKMDCAKFMVQESIEPTMRRKAVVVGGLPGVPTASYDPARPILSHSHGNSRAALVGSTDDHKMPAS